MERDAALYDLFWENSKLGPRTVRTFRRRLEQFSTTHHEHHPLVYAGAEIPLPRATDRLARLFAARRSERACSSAPLHARRLGHLLSAFAADPSGSRGFPSAGALYPLEIFCLLERVSGGPGRSVVHYNPHTHSVSFVRTLPEDYEDAVSLDGFESNPQVIVVFVLFPERVTAKYGERGGRFALIEVGHAAQNLALRIAQQGLVGCEVGGLLDDDMTRLLRLEGTGAKVALGYACGLPPRKTGRWRRPFLSRPAPLHGMLFARNSLW